MQNHSFSMSCCPAVQHTPIMPGSEASTSQRPNPPLAQHQYLDGGAFCLPQFPLLSKGWGRTTLRLPQYMRGQTTDLGDHIEGRGKESGGNMCMLKCAGRAQTRGNTPRILRQKSQCPFLFPDPQIKS